MADLKSIDFAIKGNDLASKPLSEIGAAVDKLAVAVGEIVPASEKGESSLAELKEAAGQLKIALTALRADQALIEQFTTLDATIGELAGKLEIAKTRATAAAAALVGVEKPTKALKGELTAANSALASQQKFFDRQVASLERLKAAATTAGIDLNNLAGSQRKVDAAIETAAPALARINSALAAYAANQRKAAVAAREHAEAEKIAAEKIEAARKAAELFTGEAPSLLGMFRELRASVVGLALAYVSLEGTIEQYKGAYEDLEKLEGARSQLKSSFGEDAANQMRYVRGEADKLGLAFVPLTQNYAKFASAAKANNLSLENTRSIFETFAAAIKVKKLSDEQAETLFGALVKIMSKDAIGAGDLFKKLTAELPDFAGAIRKSFGTGDLTGEQFDKILKSGKLTGDMLVGLAATYRETFAEQLPEATQDAGAAIARFQNAFKNLKQQIIEGGALEVLTQALGNLTVYLKSDDGRKFGEKMGAALKTIAEGFMWLTDHLGVVKAALEGLAAVWIFRSAVGAYNDIKRIAEGFALLAGSVKILKTELSAAGLKALSLGEKFKAATGVISAAIAGWEIGTWLYNNLSGVRVAAALVIGSFDMMWETIKGRGKLAITAIFDHSNYAAQADAFDKAQLKRVADFREQLREAGRDENGAALPSTGAGTGAETGAGDTPHTETAAEAAARTKAEIAVQMGLIEEAAKGVSNHLAELRGDLAKKGADELGQFTLALDMQLKVVRDEIDKLNADFGKSAAATVARLRAGLAAYRADALKAEQGTLDEHSATRQMQDITELARIREADIKAENDLKRYGAQDEATAQQHISDIIAKSNVEVRARVMALQGFIATLPANVQDKLHEVVNGLKVTMAQLNEIPAVNVVAVMTEEAEQLNRQLDLRAAKLDAIKQLESVHAISQAQALQQEKAIAAEYDPIVKGAKAYAEILLHSEQLTDEQRKALEKVGIQLQVTAAKAGALKDSLYTAEQVDKDLATGLTGVAADFAKAVGTGHSLKDSFHAAGDAFRKFASDFLLKIGEMIVQAQILKALQALEGSSGTGGAGGIISGLVKAGVSHSGGMAGAGLPRLAMHEWFNNAPRYHGGGVVGLDQNEIPAILQRGEEVLSRNDARNAMNGGKQSTPQHIAVYNGFDHESMVRQGLSAPSNQKVILNMIRANKNSVKAALA